MMRTWRVFAEPVTYVEVKIAPMDTIWLVLVKTEPLPATSWLSTPTLPPCGSATVGYASKKLFKMAGNLASYSLNDW